jgi:hypothetical protein
LRYPRKREMLAYYVLVAKGERLEYREAIELLREKLCLTPRIARSVLKRLRNMNYVKLVNTGSSIIVEPRDLNSVFEEMIKKYSADRCRRLGFSMQNRGSGE